MDLTPRSDIDSYGRTGFQIHGDNSSGNQSASHGCIVADPKIRDNIGRSGDNVLRVFE